MDSATTLQQLDILNNNSRLDINNNNNSSSQDTISNSTRDTLNSNNSGIPMVRDMIRTGNNNNNTWDGPMA